MNGEDFEEMPGNVGGAIREGRIVRRPAGTWTPAVHDFLNYLRDEGLPGVPEVLGVGDDGREILSYVEGRGVPVDKEVVLDNVLVEAVTWLRNFHDLADDYRPEGPVAWRGGTVELEPAQIICHNDPGAYNWIIQSGHFAAMIDWDMAGPGEPLDDLAFLAWSAIPLYRPTPVADVVRRLDLLVDAYAEWGPLTVLHAVERRMKTACERIAAGQANGDGGMLNLAKAGEPQRTLDRLEEFRQRRVQIEAAL